MSKKSETYDALTKRLTLKDELHAAVLKRMEQLEVSKRELATRMGTSDRVVYRLVFDEDKVSVELLERAYLAMGGQLKLVCVK